jgi:hypothetical protein
MRRPLPVRDILTNSPSQPVLQDLILLKTQVEMGAPPWEPR